MKVNVKGLVFVGFAAAILSGAAKAEGENIVTSKAYTDATYQAKSSALSVGNTGGVWTAADTTIEEGATSVPTTAAVKSYVDSVATTANAAQAKSTADFQVGDANGLWKTLHAGTNVGIAQDTTNTNQVNITVDQTSSLANAGSNGADEGKLITAGAVKTAVDGKQDITSGTVYKVGYNGGWSNLSAGVSATGPIVATPDANTGAVAISANTASDFTNVETEAGQIGTEDGYLPTARAVKTYVDSQATSAASDILVQTIDNSDTTHAPSGDAVYDALADKQDKQVGAAGQGGADSADKDEIVTIDANGYIQASGKTIVDTVADSNLNAVTSNAVYDYAAPITTAVTHTANTAAGTSTTPVYIANNGTATPIDLNTDQTFADVDTSSTVGTNDAKIPTSEAVKGYVDTAVSNATGGSTIPAKNTSVCTASLPCALVAEGSLLNWRVMAVSATQTTLAGTCGNLGDANCNGTPDTNE